MGNINDLWTATGTKIIYPGVVQTDDTCVFVSIAGAINHLAGTGITESDIKTVWEADGRPQPNFGLALKYLDKEIKQHSIHVQRYHDGESRFPSIDEIMQALTVNSVLIPSFELATGNSDSLTRASRWHMLSMFNLQSSQVQVWDTNNKSGFMAESAIRDLFSTGFAPIPYHPLGWLVAHDQHEAIVVSRTQTRIRRCTKSKCFSQAVGSLTTMWQWLAHSGRVFGKSLRA